MDKTLVKNRNKDFSRDTQLAIFSFRVHTPVDKEMNLKHVCSDDNYTLMELHEDVFSIFDLFINILNWKMRSISIDNELLSAEEENTIK